MKLFKNVLDDVEAWICYHRYSKLLKQIKNKQKLRVVFLVTENSKWGYQSLYEEFLNSDCFEPLVLVNILNAVHKGKDKTRNNLEENYQFFKKRGMNVEYAYKDKHYIDLKTFKPDIVFYEQVWGLPGKYKPQNVSKFALTCYSPYGLSFYNSNSYYSKTFHKKMWKYFVESNLTFKHIMTLDKFAEKNCVSFGYPKLDVYFKDVNCNLETYWKNPEKTKIIYAPHHSVTQSGQGIATFNENYQVILDLAKSHPETTWIFKPHPQFKYAVIKNKIMTENEVDNYYEEWAKIANIYTQGDYFDIFKTSDFMITDSVSFLGEYLPTLKPIINPISKSNPSTTEFGDVVTKSCYKTHSNEELIKTFEYILSRQDEKLQLRKDAVKNVIDFNEKSASKILNYLKSFLSL